MNKHDINNMRLKWKKFSVHARYGQFNEEFAILGLVCIVVGGGLYFGS